MEEWRNIFMNLTIQYYKGRSNSNKNSTRLFLQKLASRFMHKYKGPSPAPPKKEQENRNQTKPKKKGIKKHSCRAYCT